MSNFGYTRDHLWRIFGILIAWFVLFVVLTMIGTEWQTSSRKGAHGGAAVAVFMRGQVLAAVQPNMEKEKAGVNGEDEETGKRNHNPTPPNISSGSGDSGHEKSVQDIAKNAANFTWQDVTYTIPYKGGRRTLLHYEDVYS